MNIFNILTTVCIFTIVVFIGNFAFAQIDPTSDIEFFQTGELETNENQFQISNELTIREFF